MGYIMIKLSHVSEPQGLVSKKFNDLLATFSSEIRVSQI